VFNEQAIYLRTTNSTKTLNPSSVHKVFIFNCTWVSLSLSLCVCVCVTGLLFLASFVGIQLVHVMLRSYNYVDIFYTFVNTNINHRLCVNTPYWIPYIYRYILFLFIRPVNDRFTICSKILVIYWTRPIHHLLTCSASESFK